MVLLAKFLPLTTAAIESFASKERFDLHFCEELFGSRMMAT